MAAITSAQSGLWSATSTWVGGVVPGAADTVTIAAGHTVTVDGAVTVGGDTTNGLVINGTLKASRVVSSTLTLRTTPTLGTAGVWDWGTVADPIPAGVEAVVIINSSAAPASRKYALAFGVSNVFGGVHFHGATKKVRTTLTSAAASGDTVIQVADATGWAVGDKLAFDQMTSSPTGIIWRAVTAITGNTVTIGASLGAALPIGARAGNLTRNVRVVGAVGQTHQANALIWCQSAQAANTVTLSWVEAILSGGGSGSVSNTHAGSGLALLYASPTMTAKVAASTGLSCHTVYSVSGSTVTSIPVAGTSPLLTVANTQAAKGLLTAPIFSSLAASAFAALSGASAEVVDPTILGASTAFPCGNSQGPVGFRVTGGVLTCVQRHVSANAIDFTFAGTRFGAVQSLTTSDISVFGLLKYTGCAFEQAPTTTNALAAGGATVALHDGCTYPSGMLPLQFNTAQLATTAGTWSYTIRNGNGTEQQRHTNAGLMLADATLRNRGSASLQLQPWFSGTPNTHSRAVSVQAGQQITLRSYVRRNAAFDTGDVTLTLSGLGMTPVVVTAPTAADTWHLVTLTATSPATGGLTLTASAASTGGTSAACWIDGIPWEDYVPVTRHYGYAFDGLPYVTADGTITLSEAAVQALTACATLDDVYDALAWWAVSNPDSAPPYSRDGGTLVFGSRNVVIDGAAAQVISVTGSEVRIKAGALAAGSKVTSLRTTGAVSATGGASIGFGYVDASGDSYLTFTGIDSWSVYSDPARTTLLGSGAGSQRFRFTFAGGTSYYLTVVASGIEYRMTSMPAAAGETVVSLSQAALLTALQAQVAALSPVVAAVKADTGLIKTLSL